MVRSNAGSGAVKAGEGAGETGTGGGRDRGGLVSLSRDGSRRGSSGRRGSGGSGSSSGGLGLGSRRSSSGGGSRAGGRAAGRGAAMRGGRGSRRRGLEATDYTISSGASSEIHAIGAAPGLEGVVVGAVVARVTGVCINLVSNQTTNTLLDRVFNILPEPSMQQL